MSLITGLLLTLSFCLFGITAKPENEKNFKYDKMLMETSSQLWLRGREVFRPRFMDTPTNVTAIVGDSAFLPCSVAHLGDKSVTWMRQRDLHILTAGVFTYSADERFRVLHPENSDDWTLQIKFATLRDSGVYECQVNSDPKMSRQVILIVKEQNQLDDPGTLMEATDTSPLVVIQGPETRHIQQGSVLALTCVTRHPLKNIPKNVQWFHEGHLMDYNSPRGGVSIQVEKSQRRTLSMLMLSSITTKDSGVYSCNPTDFMPATVTIHVDEADQFLHAAVHQKGFSGALSPFLSSWMQVFTSVCTVLFLRTIWSTAV